MQMKITHNDESPTHASIEICHQESTNRGHDLDPVAAQQALNTDLAGLLALSKAGG